MPFYALQRILISALTGITLLLLSCAGPDNPVTADKVAMVRTPTDVVPSEVLSAARESLQTSGVERLRWGLIPYVAPDEIVARYSPIINRVSERLGVPIDIVVGNDYQHLEELIVTGQVDVAVLGPYAYVRARKRAPSMEVFASHIALGSTTYGTYILTHEDSGIEHLNDIVGRRIAFVDRRSTSGWLSPAAHMLEKGINPVTDVEALYLGSHERVFGAVARGEVAAGAVYGAILSEGRKRNSEGSQIIVLAKCARIPYDAYVIRAGVEPVVGDALALALGEISTRDRKGRRTLASLARINGFVPVTDDHYNTIRQLEDRILKELGPEVLNSETEHTPISSDADQKE
jgi:phosphonate transport system substrate-binding protein